MDSTADKSELRRFFKTRRNALSPAQRRQYDFAICQAVKALPEFAAAEFVAAFVSFGAEPDVSALFHGKSILLPRFNPGLQAYELVAVNDFKRDLLPGKYGILEPLPELPVFSPDLAASRALFLVPAVACDRKGIRLGRGGGFYDRLLAGVQTPPVAVIYSCQLSETALPGAVHDIPMGYVVTEREVIVTRENF